MKKKLLLSIVLAALCSFIITGCGSSDDDPVLPLNTPVNLGDPDSLIGTYEIDYFLTDALMFKITNNCDKAKALWSNTECDPADDVKKAAKAVIKKNDNGSYSLTTQMQMWEGIFSSNKIPEAAVGAAKNNMYNYTVYAAVNAKSINKVDGTINQSDDVKGVSGRNMAETTTDENATFHFTLQDDGTIVSELTLPTLFFSTTKVVLRKVSDTPEHLDPNTLLDKDAPGFESFNEDVSFPTPVDLNDKKTLQGTYDVTFFGSGVENVRPDTLMAFAGRNYITNDSASAISAGLCTDNSSLVVPGTLPFCDSSSQTTMIGGKLVITVDGGGADQYCQQNADGRYYPCFFSCG